MKPLRYGMMLYALACAACSLEPVYQTPVMPVPVAYKGATELWQRAQPSDTLSRGDWWLRYDDPTLNQLISRLDAANIDLTIAVAHFEEANAYAEQAHAGLFPTITAGAYTTRNRQSDTRALRSSTQPDDYGDNALGMTLGYELDLWGRVRSLAKAGQAGAQAAAADMESIRLSLRAELADDYLALRILDNKAKLLADEVESYSNAVTLTQNRFLGEIDSALNVSRAKAQLATTQERLSENSAERALYEHAIATLIGESASTYSIAPVVMELHLPDIPLELPATILQRRPDIAAAERRLAEANAQIGVTKAAFYPTINLAATGGYESTYQPGLLSAPNLFWSIGPNALLTLFDAGRRTAVVAQAQAAFDAAGGQYRLTVLRAFQEVEDNLSLLNELYKESVALNDAVLETNHSLNLAMNLYRAGAVSYLDVVSAQTLAQQAEFDALNVQKRRLQASIGLIRALGGGWSSSQKNDSQNSASK
ncbi:efflux transporter outer membrane subunit [Solimicrobium silvestre]|uniref:Efflux transporter, outer membrane factor (OMF) lipoprotein, NodT family n=1 Tax=Solimicrobium silvestre TaxID=2099400 RepID=A0A2S9GZX2_9BURK|nr:efflux transporter outer membrane subunit [Solimicrobium silvestre]PRC93250.1 Efflux transporter, outer membrane factor (OMF) lipoprotein, NodT family [Solimicrobium silvestre]